MDYQPDTARLHAPIPSSCSSSVTTALESSTDNNSIQQHHHQGSFISLRCRPTLTTLPPELLSKISYNLSLCDYSFLSRTCSRLHSHLFHPAELVLFLKTRYRLSIQSGSIIIFAYLANMQVRAPLLLERIFEDFFADSPLRLQEEQKWKLQCQQQRQKLSNNTYQLNQAILSKANSSSSSSDNSSSLEYQRMDGIEVHKAAEKARRQAKWDAVRMLGVLYALDKTHIGPSSSTNALVLSGACDPPEPAPPAPEFVPSAPSTVTETETATAPEKATTSSSFAAFAPSSFLAIAPASMPDVSSFSSSFTTTTSTTATTGVAGTDETATPSFLYHATSSSMSISGFSSPSPYLRNGQDPPGRSRSLQEGYGQQDLDTVPRSRCTSLDYSDLAPQHQHQHQATTHTRNIRKRPSPSIPSKNGKMSSSSSSSWWEPPLTQQYASSDSSRFSPTRTFSPPSARHHHYHHHHHQRQRSPPSFSPSSSSTSLTSVFSPMVPGSRVHQSAGGGSAVRGATSGAGTGLATSSTTAVSRVAQPEGPSQASTSPTTSSSTSSSSFSSSSTSSLLSSSASSFAVQDEARQRFSNRRSKCHMNLRAMMKERALNGDREAMEYVEYSHELARHGCWPVDLGQDFDLDASYYHHHRLVFDARDNGGDYCANTDVATASGMHEMNDLPMDVDGCETNEWMQRESTAPIVMTTKFLSSSSSSSCLPIASAVSPRQQTFHKSTSSLSSSKDLQLPTVSPSSSIASCSSHSSSFANWTVLPEREKGNENESVLGTTPLGISIPLIEANTNGGGGNGRWQVSGNDSCRSSDGGSDGSSSSWRMGVPSALSSSSLFSQGVSFRHPRGGQIHQQQRSQSPLSRNAAVSANPLTTSTTTPLSTSTATTTVTSTPSTTGTQQKMQQILNRNDKIAFLTKYTDRMHLKLQALGIEDWGQGDIQRKKTYQLMIQHNDKTGEKDLVKFYLGRYGGSVTTASDSDVGAGAGMQGVQEPMGPLGLPLSLSVQQRQQQGQEQQGTPVVVQA